MLCAIKDHADGKDLLMRWPLLQNEMQRAMIEEF